MNLACQQALDNSKVINQHPKDGETQKQKRHKHTNDVNCFCSLLGEKETFGLTRWA